MRIIEAKVRAGARERSVEELEPGVYKVKTTTAPEKGRANRDVIELLADYLGLAKSRLEIVGGHTSSRKRIRIN
ncbi:DUF167 domain-containing protein [Patescibacteria group bacterium]